MSVTNNIPDTVSTVSTITPTISNPIAGLQNATATGKRISTIENNMASVGSTVNSIQTVVNDLTTSHASLSQDVADTKSAVSDVASAVSTLASKSELQDVVTQITQYFEEYILNQSPRTIFNEISQKVESLETKVEGWFAQQATPQQTTQASDTSKDIVIPKIVFKKPEKKK